MRAGDGRDPLRRQLPAFAASVRRVGPKAWPSRPCRHRCIRAAARLRLRVLLRCVVALVGGVVAGSRLRADRLRLAVPLAIAVLVLVRARAAHRAARGSRPALRHRLQLRGDGVDALVGTDAWIALCALESIYFVPSGHRPRLEHSAAAWPLWTALWWVGVETWRSGLAVQRPDVGPTRLRHRRHPVGGRLPWIGMTGVSLLIALTGTTLAWLVLRLRDRPARAALVAGAAGVVTVAPVLARSPSRRRHDHGRRRAGRRPRRRHRRRWPSTARSPRNHCAPPASSPGRRGGTRPSRTSWCGRRTPPPSTRSPTPGATPGS